MTDDDTVEVPRKCLEQLVAFAETHGDEYAWPAVYLAVEDAKAALGKDDREPYIIWKQRWNDIDPDYE